MIPPGKRNFIVLSLILNTAFIATLIVAIVGIGVLHRQVSEIDLEVESLDAAQRATVDILQTRTSNAPSTEDQLRRIESMLMELDARLSDLEASIPVSSLGSEVKQQRLQVLEDKVASLSGRLDIVSSQGFAVSESSNSAIHTLDQRLDNTIMRLDDTIVAVAGITHILLENSAETAAVILLIGADMVVNEIASEYLMDFIVAATSSMKFNPETYDARLSTIPGWKPLGN